MLPPSIHPKHQRHHDSAVNDLGRDGTLYRVVPHPPQRFADPNFEQTKIREVF
jgi:hypothetical protein